MSRAKIEDLSSISENLGLYVEVGSDSEDDDWEMFFTCIINCTYHSITIPCCFGSRKQCATC